MLKNNLKSLQHSNDADYFQRLNLVFLKDYAKSVVTKFSKIPFDRIVLYRYRNKHFPFKWFNIKYAMVFFVKDTVDQQSYEKFEAASGIRQTVMDDMKYVQICVDQHFSEAYKDNQTEDYIGEWFFIPQLASEAIYPGVEVEGHKWILYDGKVAYGLPPDSFLLKARQEVQVIYDYIRKNCGGLLTSPSELKHKKALECFQRDKKNFKILTIKDLNDTEIYDISTQPKREIIGRILDKIVLRKNYISKGSQKLFMESQKLFKKTA